MKIVRKTLGPLSITAAVVLAANMPLWAPWESRSQHDPVINPRAVASIRDSRPAIALIGNSMMNTRVNDRRLSERLDRRALKFFNPGSTSACWYLVLKNVVIPASPRPSIAVIFFRDQILTDPTNSVRGKRKGQIESYASANEPELDRRAIYAEMGDFAYFFYRYWPLSHGKEWLKPWVETGVKDWSARAGRGLTPGGADAAIDRAFAERNMDPELFGAYQVAAFDDGAAGRYDFDANVGKSFLPITIDLAQESGIQLVFVRVKRERDADGTRGAEQADQVESYVRDLRAYLEARDLPFFDYTHEDSIRLEHFSTADHLNARGQRVFTADLAEKLAPIVRRRAEAAWDEAAEEAARALRGRLGPGDRVLVIPDAAASAEGAAAFNAAGRLDGRALFIDTLDDPSGGGLEALHDEHDATYLCILKDPLLHRWSPAAGVDYYGMRRDYAGGYALADELNLWTAFLPTQTATKIYDSPAMTLYAWTATEPAAGSETTVETADFESGFGSWGGRWEIIGENVHGGASAARLRRNPNGGIGRAASPRLDLRPIDTVAVQMWTRVEGADPAPIVIRANYFDAGGQRILRLRIVRLDARDLEGWTLHTAILPRGEWPEGAETFALTYEIRANYEGTLYLDDLRVLGFNSEPGSGPP